MSTHAHVRTYLSSLPVVNICAPALAMDQIAPVWPPNVPTHWKLNGITRSPWKSTASCTRAWVCVHVCVSVSVCVCVEEEGHFENQELQINSRRVKGTPEEQARTPFQPSRRGPTASPVHTQTWAVAKGPAVAGRHTVAMLVTGPADAASNLHRRGAWA